LILIQKSSETRINSLHLFHDFVATGKTKDTS